MRTSQRRRLIDLLGIQSKSGKTSRIRAYMYDTLVDAGATVIKKERQLFAVKGDTSRPIPYYVAHSDTVHDIVAEKNYAVGMYTNKGEIIYYGLDPETKGDRGVGGDDKCGLFVCLEAMHALDNVGVIVTIDEERGCLGARKIDARDMAHASVLIQADRRGNEDAVREAWAGKISGEDWQDEVGPIVKSYGYDWCNHGAGTDVIPMGERAKLSAINLSAGYYDPHTSRETVRESDVEQALDLAIDLGVKSGGRRWDFERPVRERATYGGTAYGQSNFAYGGAIQEHHYYDETIGVNVTRDGRYAISVRSEPSHIVKFRMLDEQAMTDYITWLRTKTVVFDDNARPSRHCSWRICEVADYPGQGGLIRTRSRSVPFRLARPDLIQDPNKLWERGYPDFCTTHLALVNEQIVVFEQQSDARRTAIVTPPPAIIPL